MARFEVEVIGHFSSVLEVEAETYEEAEILATEEFERDFSPYSANHGWTDCWGATEVEMCKILDEDEDEDE